MKLAFFTGEDPSIRTLNPEGRDDTACVVICGPDDKLLLHVESAIDARRIARALEAAAVALDRARGAA